jgi:hypothetical protein
MLHFDYVTFIHYSCNSYMLHIDYVTLIHYYHNSHTLHNNCVIIVFLVLLQVNKRKCNLYNFIIKSYILFKRKRKQKRKSFFFLPTKLLLPTRSGPSTPPLTENVKRNPSIKGLNSSWIRRSSIPNSFYFLFNIFIL